VFIPAVTMRIWAEERKENTWEMLLTFPMKGWELVIGKFLAALVFYMLALAATCTVPAMLFNLGKPDPGAIIGGYFGTLLMGSFFLALGILFSGFFKDQIVAFVVTLLTCLAFFLVGTDFMSSYLDGRISGLGSVMADLLGVFTHYGGFTRGVIDVADTAFFLVWIAVFLALNVLYIDGRSRPGARTIFAVATVMCVAIGMLFNYVVAGTSIARLDMTQNKVYTVSKASKEIISGIDSEVQVKLYVTAKDKMPTQMRNLERDITDKLRDIKVASGGKLNFDTVYLDAANVRYTEPKSKDDKEKKTEAETVEQRMLDKGVEPFAAQAMSQDEMTSKLVYSSLGVAYKDKPEEIIPQIIPDEMAGRGPSAATVPVSQLEYRLVNTIYKMTRPKKAVVAMVAPKDRIDPQMRQMLMQMGQRVPEAEDPYESVQQILEYEKYDVKRVELTKESPMPDDCDTLVVLNPTALNERQLWEINRALYSGKSVVLAVQTYEWNYEVTRDGIRMQREDVQGGKGNPMMGQQPEKGPKLNDLLKDYGITVSDSVLMDKNSVTLTVPGKGQGLQALMGQPVASPTHILITNTSMAQDSPITNRLSGILYLWGTALDIDKAKMDQSGLKSEVLMTSGPQSWSVGAKEPMTEATFKVPESGTKPYPLMALVTGQFPDAYKDKPRPAYPKAQKQPGEPPEPETPDTEAAAKPVEAKPGKLILLGCAEMFRKNFMQGGGAAGGLDLFLNMVDGVTLDDRLVDVRGRKPIDRMIVKPEENVKTVWRIVNYGLANVIIAAVGVTFFALRRRSRNAYTMAQSRAN
jgi:ABC-type transport system involved in multi-copper enzyme maturation permease subunit/ABC-type uncharacterized transport system involved in gliding motility auxiliary subunit